MRKDYFFLVILLAPLFFYGQVGINDSGSAPDASAMLDVASTTKGVLIPRMTASERDNISSPATGLTVYVTDDNKFYYYDGSSWVQVEVSGKAWLLSGNSGTNSSVNFIGTTDAQDLIFKTNNNTIVTIDQSGHVGIGAISSGYQLTVYPTYAPNGLMSVATSSTTFGGAFFNTDASGTGIVAAGNNTTIVYLTDGSGSGSVGTKAGTYGYGKNSTDGVGVIGIGNGLTTYYASSNGAGAEFTGNRYGAFGHATEDNDAAVGLYGVYESTNGYDATGVVGYSMPAASYGYGVVGYGGWVGVYGYTDSNGLYGIFSYGDAGVSGDLDVSGTKSFLIDHPADPANKYLKHFSIESNEVLNVYRGNVTLDSNGEATVQLPDYFHLINRNFSYQLTPVGSPAPGIYIAKEIDTNGRFKIAGGSPGQKISWYVFAERNDPYLQHYPEKRQVVVEKKDKERGKYLRPELYGQPQEKALFYRNINLPSQKHDLITIPKEKIAFPKILHNRQ